MEIKIGNKYRTRGGVECIVTYHDALDDHLPWEVSALYDGDVYWVSNEGYYADATDNRDLVEDLGPLVKVEPQFVYVVTHVDFSNAEVRTEVFAERGFVMMREYKRSTLQERLEVDPSLNVTYAENLRGGRYISDIVSETFQATVKVSPV